MLVSLIIPAYKQQKTIREDVEKIYETMCNTRFDFEIIVVVDGFVDNTFEEAQKVEKSNVKVVGYENNRGKGYAVRYGMARAKGDPIAFIDSGMDINPNGISIILEQMIMYNADIVVASKGHPKSEVTYYSSLRRLYSWGYHLGVFILFGLKIRDTQTGLKIYRRKVLEAVLPRLVVKAFAFDIELLAVSNYMGFKKIYEAPVKIELKFTDNSKFNKNRPLFLDPSVRNVLWDTLAVFYRLRILKYYDSKSNRKWVYDKELDMKVNTGELIN